MKNRLNTENFPQKQKYKRSHKENLRSTLFLSLKHSETLFPLVLLCRRSRLSLMFCFLLILIRSKYFESSIRPWWKNQTYIIVLFIIVHHIIVLVVNKTRPLPFREYFTNISFYLNDAFITSSLRKLFFWNQ